jgi:hypothetical protein
LKFYRDIMEEPGQIGYNPLSRKSTSFFKVVLQW